MRKSIVARFVMTLSVAIIAFDASAQFVSRYPLLKGYRNHTYFEGYEMPTVGTGPTDPVASPDGRFLYFAARGFLWRYTLATGEAEQFSGIGTCDSQPAISPDGTHLAFVRDETTTTRIMLVDLGSSSEPSLPTSARLLVSSGMIDCLPAFSADGKEVYYSSSVAGDMDVWKVEIATDKTTRVTSDVGLELQPLPLPDGKRMVYVAKTRSGADAVRVLNLADGKTEDVLTGSILSQIHPALRADGRVLAVNLPDAARFQKYQLWLVDLAKPQQPIALTHDLRLPLMPAWSADGVWIYFVEADRDQHFRLYRLSARGGGKPEELPINVWTWKHPMAKVVIRTALEGSTTVVPSRLSVIDESGHPVFPARTNVRFDSLSGMTYFHSPGVVEIEAREGSVTVTASHGFIAPAVRVTKSAQAGATTTIDLVFSEIWNPRSHGWYGGDNHFHMNYGGLYDLTPEDLLPMMRGEDLDVAVPMTANLNNRMMDQEWIGWARYELPAVVIGQEVRNHFLGHIGLFNHGEWFWPWIYGPSYPVFGKIDMPNSDVLLFARQHGGINTYVHPIYSGNPFDEKNLDATPVSLVTDAVLGHIDSLEIACAWINALGTSELWYRLLNIGQVIVPNAGSDTFPNYYRNLIFGSSRLYGKIDGAFSWSKYVEALRRGRSFASTGPLLDFQVGGQGPGTVLKVTGKASWTLQVYTPVEIEHAEIVVNGQVVFASPGPLKPGAHSFQGSVTPPRGGWIAARAYGGKVIWPVMDSMPFAHTAPLWFGVAGSVDSEASQAAAVDLLRVLDAATKRLDEGYNGADIPRIREEFAEAHRRLEKLAKPAK